MKKTLQQIGYWNTFTRISWKSGKSISQINQNGSRLAIRGPLIRTLKYDTFRCRKNSPQASLNPKPV